MTNKAMLLLLFQMSPLPLCVLSLLPCEAPKGCEAQQRVRKCGGRVERPVAFSCHSELRGTASQAEPVEPGPEIGGFHQNMSRAEASSWTGATALPSLLLNLSHFYCARQVKLPEEASLLWCFIRYQPTGFSSVCIAQLIKTWTVSMQMVTEVT